MKKVESKTKLYRCWEYMKARCYNKNRKEYVNYGGRGITVCKDWHLYINFKHWALNNGYSPNLELDRIDVNGNYSPENCRFVTHSENNLNKRKRKDNTSGYTGVYFHKQSRIYGYEIQVNNKRIRKYGFSTALEAYNAKMQFIKDNDIKYNNL